MSAYSVTVIRTDVSGTEIIIPNQQVSILYRTGGIAPIWQDEAMTIPADNPATTDSRGVISFFATPNEYKWSADVEGKLVEQNFDSATSIEDVLRAQGYTGFYLWPQASDPDVILNSYRDVILYTDGLYYSSGGGVTISSTDTNRTSLVTPVGLKNIDVETFSSLISSGDVYAGQIYTVGDRINSEWEVSLTSDVTPNGINVVQSTAIPEYSLVWRQTWPLNLGDWGARGGVDIAPLIRQAHAYLSVTGGEIFLPQNSGGSYLFSTLDTNGNDCVTISAQNISIVGETFGTEIDCTIDCTNMIGVNAGFLNFEAENLFMRGSDDSGTTVYADHAIQTPETTTESSRIKLTRIGGEYFDSHGVDIWTVDAVLDQVKFAHCIDGSNTAYAIRLRGQPSSNVPSTATSIRECGGFNCDNGLYVDKATYVAIETTNFEQCELAFDIQRADTLVMTACGGEEIAKACNFGDSSDANKTVRNLILNGMFIFDVVNRKSTGTPSDRLFSFNRTKGKVSGIEMTASQAGFVNNTPVSVDTNSEIDFVDGSVERKQVIALGDGQAKFPEADANTSTGLNEIIYVGNGGDDDLNGDSSAGSPYATWGRVAQLLPDNLNQRYTIKVVGTLTGDISLRNKNASLGQDTGTPVLLIEGNTGASDTVTGSITIGGCTGGEGGNGIEVSNLTVDSVAVGSSLSVRLRCAATSTSLGANIKSSHVILDQFSVTGNPTQAVNVTDTSIAKVRNVSGDCQAAINSQASTVYKSGTAFTVGADTTQQAGQILT